MDHNQSTGVNELLVDGIALLRDESAPALATNTPIPPTATPIPTSTPIPTATPIPSETATPTETPTSEPTATPTETATFTPSPTNTFSPTPTATPSPTFTPTLTPTPTATPTPSLLQRVLPPSMAEEVQGDNFALGALINLAGLTGAFMIGGIFVWLFRRQ
ncbi:MAG: hypothetical protein J5I90_13115 [Caldilineales bacterium]|nr:hypothetical protein [Caldilineales bacterium]